VIARETGVVGIVGPCGGALARCNSMAGASLSLSLSLGRGF
jgi:hypothetical protein